MLPYTQYTEHSIKNKLNNQKAAFLMNVKIQLPINKCEGGDVVRDTTQNHSSDDKFRLVASSKWVFDRLHILIKLNMRRQLCTIGGLHAAARAKHISDLTRWRIIIYYQSNTFSVMATLFNTR